MRADLDADTVAGLARTATSLDATVLLFRAVPSFEIEFAALEMEDDLDLTAWDEAVLGLAQARGAVTPHDTDAYLGLGEELSGAVVDNLAQEGLLAPIPAPTAEGSEWQQSPYLGLVSLLGRVAGLSGWVPSESRLASRARLVKDSGAPDAPLRRLTEAGIEAVRRGKRAVRFSAKARLIFWENPLRFIELESERGRRYGQLRRDEPLKPEAVPPAFRTIDDALALPPEERERRIGIGTGIPGLRGRLVGVSPDSVPTLVGVEPGKTWEVRRLPESREGLLVAAGFGASLPEGLVFRTLVGSPRELRDDVHLPASTLLDPAVCAPNVLVQALRDRGYSAIDLAPHGALRVRARADEIGGMMGIRDAPSDTFVRLDEHVADWSVAVRVRALPADRGAAEKAFFGFLGRRRDKLRANLEHACRELAATLAAYWSEPFEPPRVEDVLAEMWKSSSLRAVICERRLASDLVAPYASSREP